MIEIRLRDAGSALRWCAECADETVFEVPPCEDGHGVDCLDVVCTTCGLGLVLGLHGLGAHDEPEHDAARPVAA